jgi:hypothetical protein
MITIIDLMNEYIAHTVNYSGVQGIIPAGNFIYIVCIKSEKKILLR